jgi:RNA polymerase sigma-70 factor (ECF subfamily)
MKDLLEFQSYLLLLASRQLQQTPELRLEPMDLVQETFARAHMRWEQYAGTSDSELAGWLRNILTNYWRDILRRQGHEVDEQRLRSELNESSLRLERWLVSDELTPRRISLCRERILDLADKLWELPEGQRMALQLRYLEGCSVAQICERMDRTPASVGGLLQRGLARLRSRLDDDSHKA